MRGSQLKGALAAAPRGGRVSSMPVNPATQAVTGAMQGAQGAGLQRMSPGVYRNQQGSLVNSKGGALPGQRQQPQRPSMQVQQPPMRTLPYNFPPGAKPQWLTGNAPGAAAGIAAGMGGGMGNAMPQDQQQPSWRMPAPLQPGNYGAQPGMMYAGGSPNFNEQTGQYNPYLSAITQASQAAQQQMGQPQYNPQMQQNMQPQQGIVANQQPIAPQGQLSPAELQAMQNGTFKGYNY